ncbi:hypothetical protein JVU11DRAFT_757 [Chiua virens]|nr:hypothetical protein JVU11DRAFT_757 [Chiua virens]
MQDPEEYEVESVTRARVHDKKGKKITWTYYVKWKGYSWDESTWEPADSFQGSEHIVQSFWERIDVAFKKGEEVFISGPPGRKGLKRKGSSLKTPASPPSKNDPSSNGASISAPAPASRKRRRVQSTADDDGYSRSRKLSTRGQRNGRAGTSAKSTKRRRASSPGPRKPTPKRLPSVGDSQLDADGETDPDVVEVEDELMHVSTEDADEEVAGARPSVPTKESANGAEKVEFEDLEHFYSGNPIDIDQTADETTVVQKPGNQPRSETPPPATPTDAVPTSPTPSAHNPLFDSPPRPSDKASEVQKDPLPHHRTRTAKPLVKFLDPTTVEASSKQTRITAKARLLSVSAKDASSASGPSSNTAKRGKKPGPGRSSSGLTTRNRSSLLTADKGTLKSVKGKYATTASEQDQPDEIEEAPLPGDNSKAEGDKLIVTSWSDEDVVDQDKAASNSQPDPPLSGKELLRLAGIHQDSETLPDYEDNTAGQPQGVEETQASNSTSAPVEEESRDSSSVKVTEESKAGDHIANTSLSVPEVAQQAATPVTGEAPVVAPPIDDAVKNNIELAKEHLFPSIQTQMSFNSFNATQSSFRSTIFGPLYQGLTVNSEPVTENESLTMFKVILGDGVELPMVLKDCSEIKTRISDILIGNSSGSKVALFYSTEDAGAMVNTFKSDGTAQVVLDPAAEAIQQECFSTFLQRFQASNALIAPVGKEVCVMYSSENASIAERLGAPNHLRGLSRTLLISHASIENQLAYVAAIMKATAL